MSLESVWNVFFMTVHLQNYKSNTEKMLEKRSRKITCWNIQKCKCLITNIIGVGGVQGQENSY